MSKQPIDYQAMPSAAEAGQWDLSTAQRKLLGKIIPKPQPYFFDGKDYLALEELSGKGVIEFHNGESRVWRATPVGYGLMAQALPDYFDAFQAEYWRARNLHRTDRPDPREGWASTKPGKTKYHHYDRKGESACNYQREAGPLHYHPDQKALTPAECCSSCDLHMLKAQATTIKPAPKSDRLRVGWASINMPDSPYHFWNSNGAKVCTYEGEYRPRFFYPKPGQPTQLEACPRCWAHAHPAASQAPKKPSTPAPAPQQLSLF